MRVDQDFSRGWSRGAVAVAALMLAASGAALADLPQTGRSARLTFVAGYVHIDRVDQGAAHQGPTAGDPAQLNMPLTQGSVVVTGEDGQAEVEFEDGSVARLSPNSVLNLRSLAMNGSNYSTQLDLTKGLGYFELRSAPKFVYRVNAGGDVVSPVENATIRVAMDEAPAAVAVLDGTARVEREGGYSTDVVAGETFRGDAPPGMAGRYFLTQEIVTDSWDQWNEERDQAAADAEGKQTTAREGFSGEQGYGWSDLDANGNWYNVAGQGQVWQPEGGDAEDFDPYGNGSWVWYPGAGYLWASGYGWGWTPYRCGSWSYWDSFGWGWQPNGGCGIFGYGGYGGSINIARGPRNYPIHRIPFPGRGGVHPIVPVHGGPVRERPVGAGESGRRMIAGVEAKPLRPVGASYTPRGGSAVGASLRNDFPVDSASRSPVLGAQPTRSAALRTGVRDGGATTGVMRPVVPQGAVGTAQPGMRPAIQPGGQGMRPVPPASSFARPGAGVSPQNDSMRGPSSGGQGMSRPSAPSQGMSHPSYSAPPASSFHSAPSAPASGGGAKK